MDKKSNGSHFQLHLVMVSGCHSGVLILEAD